MKRSQRWSVDSDEGPGSRKSPTGPFRRRRALRRLDSLAQHPARELSPAVAHVRVIGGSDSDDTSDTSDTSDRSGPAALAQPEGASTEVPSPRRDVRIVSDQLGDQLYAVPIDEPLRASL
jgi:hypothetical protein